MHFATACATAAVGLAYAHAVHLVVPPGALRLVCFAPCVAANALLPVVYMDPLGEDSSVVACAVAAAAFGWWTNFKLLALASGRGQLVGHASLPMFLAVGALPIRLDPANPNPNPLVANDVATTIATTTRPRRLRLRLRLIRTARRRSRRSRSSPGSCASSRRAWS